MKQGSFKIICLVLLACITVFSGFGDENTVSYETRILEPFNGLDDDKYVWKAEASKFISKKDSDGNEVTLPELVYVEAWPVAAFGYNRGDNDKNLRSLGIRASFDRQGYNWIDLYPVLSGDADGNPAEIRIPGRVQNFDLWVWGSNLKYYIEIYLRDYQGVIHTLRLGDISYTGWKNLRVNVPGSIPQAKRILPAYAGLTFVKFRIWTQPVEKVNTFYIYIKQLKILTDIFEALFDGNDLANPEFVDQIWAKQ